MTNASATTLASEDCREVLDAERLRARCVVAGDLDALAPLLHEDLVYVHAPGTRHGKHELLAALAGGPRFLEVTFKVERQFASGDLCVLQGALHLRLLRAGEENPVQVLSHASAVWQRAAPGWQLRSFQSTRVAP